MMKAQPKTKEASGARRAIQRDSFFRSLSQNAARDLEEMLVVSEYPEDSMIFMEKQESRGIFVLLEGQLKISVSSSDGKTLIMRIAQPGDFLELNTALSNKPYETTAETLYKCRIGFVRRDDFLRFLALHPEGYAIVARELSENYHKACEHLRTVGLASTVSERLARLLLEWSAAAPETTGGTTRVKLSLTHGEIGEFIGTTRETVSRTFRDLKERQLAILQGATLMIPNRAALENYAGI